MGRLIGSIGGAFAGVVVAYVLAIMLGSDAPWLGLFLPVGLILGWRISAAMGTVIRCPACREDVKRDATICPHCRQILSTTPTMHA